MPVQALLLVLLGIWYAWILQVWWSWCCQGLGWRSISYNWNSVSIVDVMAMLNIHLFFCRNSSGSTPLHLAAGTGHISVVSYLLKQKGGQGIQAALDNDGKSPLAVCLDNRMNDWEKTAQLLRDAYNTRPVSMRFASCQIIELQYHRLQVSPSHLPCCRTPSPQRRHNSGSKWMILVSWEI